MKLGLYAGGFVPPNTQENRDANLLVAQRMQEHGLTHFQLIKPWGDVEGHFAMCDAHGITCGITPLIDHAAWKDAGFSQANLEAQLQPLAYLNNTSCHDIYGGHEVLEYMTRAQRAIYVAAVKAVFPNIPCRMYYDTVGYTLPRIDWTTRPADILNPADTPWADYFVADINETGIMHFAVDSNTVEDAEKRFLKNYGYILSTAGIALPDPYLYCHFSHSPNQGNDLLRGRLEVLKKYSPDIVLVRFLDGQGSGGSNQVPPTDEQLDVIQSFLGVSSPSPPQSKSFSPPRRRHGRKNRGNSTERGRDIGDYPRRA